jgi:hypothetical protein
MELWGTLGNAFARDPYGALTSAGTLLLALATFWLGLKTRDLAKRTGEELDLLRQQTEAMKENVRSGQAQLMELREARFAEFLPMLRWQSPAAYVDKGAGLVDRSRPFQMQFRILLTNEGPGPARIKLVDVTTDTREPITTPSLGVPSTLPSGERITFNAYGERVAAFEYRPRVFKLRIVYCDLLGEFDYETVAVVRTEMSEQRPDSSDPGAIFLDSDERSALERRMTKVPRPTS